MLVLLDFYADWCGPCKIMVPIFEEIEKKFKEKIEFKKIDVETDEKMAAKFQVMSIPTFVLLKNDKEIDRKTGAMPKELLENWLSDHLK